MQDVLIKGLYFSVRQGHKPTLEELHRMTYLKNIVQEVLRLYPPRESPGLLCTSEV